LIAGVIVRMWNNIKELQLCTCIAILLTILSSATVISNSSLEKTKKNFYVIKTSA